MTTHLYRSTHDRMLAGVAGGLAELWDADPSLVRIVWALLVPLTGGIALVVYIVMAIVVPEEDDPRVWMPSPGRPPAPGGPSGAPPDSAAGPAAPAFAGEPAAATSTPTTASPQAGPASPYEERMMRRAARHEARLERAASRRHDGRSGALIIGILLILVGAWSLVREYLPQIDWDWFWPLALVGFGIVVLYLAVRPARDEPESSQSSERSAGS